MKKKTKKRRGRTERSLFRPNILLVIYKNTFGYTIKKGYISP